MTDDAPGAPFCSTSGKVPLVPVINGGPALWSHGKGARFWDAGGSEWLDFDLCLGSIVWGHARQEITDAVASALTRGSAPTVPSLLEQQASEALRARLPRYGAALFVKTGADACTLAVRLARHATRRSYVISDGFHGWHDWGIAGAYPERRDVIGVPSEVQAVNHRLHPSEALGNSLEAIGTRAGEIAALVLRPEAWEGDALRALITAGHAAGALAICDEVTSHLKYPLGGSAAAREASPDLLCIGKGLANGLPLAALLGPRDILDWTVEAKVSSTNASETASLAAMIAAETLLARTPTWPSWRGSLERVTANLRTMLEREGIRECRVAAHPGFFSIERPEIPFGTDPLRTHIVAELGARHIYTRGWFHGTDAHDERDWQKLESALRDALLSWKNRPIP